MRTAFTFAAIIALAVLSFGSTQTVSAQEKKVSAANPAGATSATPARHKHRTARAAPAPARPAWTGPDPTRGGQSDYIRQMQREGRCIIDEGYGRYTACSNP